MGLLIIITLLMEGSVWAESALEIVTLIQAFPLPFLQYDVFLSSTDSPEHGFDSGSKAKVTHIYTISDMPSSQFMKSDSAGVNKALSSPSIISHRLSTSPGGLLLPKSPSALACDVLSISSQS